MTRTETPLALNAAGPPRPVPSAPRATVATILVVDPSRVCADAVRRFLRGLGARMRRAGSLAEARRHLAVYRPDAVLVAMGLPDGRGEVLIRALRHAPAPPHIVALSSFGELEHTARRAGADVFLARPLLTQASFAAAFVPVIGTTVATVAVPRARAARLARGPCRAAGTVLQSALPIAGGNADIDPLALRDDLRQACAALNQPAPGADRGYARRFVGSLARAIGDRELCAMTEAGRDAATLQALTAALRDRIARLPPL